MAVAPVAGEYAAREPRANAVPAACDQVVDGQPSLRSWLPSENQVGGEVKIGLCESVKVYTMLCCAVLSYAMLCAAG